MVRRIGGLERDTNIIEHEEAADAHHDGLLCLDILIAIFEQFDKPELECKVVCANAALASRTFAAVALPVLWRQLPNLFPLLYILAPTDVQRPPKISSINMYAYQERDLFATMVLRSKRYLDEECWGVFSHNASLVRTLQDACQTSSEVRLLGELITRNGGDTFLPALRRLFWSQASFSGLALTSLACASLVDLYIRFVDERTIHLDRDSNELSRLLPAAFPSLQNSMFVSRHNSRDDTLARDVLGFKHLRTLVIDTTRSCNLSHDDLGLLFSTLKLERIALWLSSWDVRDPSPLHAPHLRSLELRGPAVELATAASCLRGSNLQCIALEVQGGLPIRLQGMHTMLASVCTSPISSSLTQLEIYVYNMALSGIDETLLLSKVLHPCFSMRQLQYLSFTYDRWRDRAVVCTDEDILAIAMSLGSLRHLKLHVTSSLSPLSLVHLARHCRELAEVYLRAVSVEDVTTLPLLAQKLPHPLRSLFLREGPLLAAIDSSDPSESLAEFLSGLFPNVVVTPWPRLPAEDMWQSLGITSGWNHPFNDGDMYCNMSPGDCQILGARV